MNSVDHIDTQERISTYHRAILLVGLMFLLFNVLDAPIRLIFSQVGLSALVYLPKLLMIPLIAMHLWIEPGEEGFSEKRLIALLILAFSMIVGMLFVPMKQVLVGVYVLIPFIFGVVCAQVFIRYITRFKMIFVVTWLTAVVGVLTNQFIEFPWEGLSYSVGDVEVAGSRTWYASGGKKRIAGFARASFDAAGQIQILAIILIVQVRSFTLRALIWGLTIAAIVPTNSKGILLVSAVLMPVVLFRSFIPVILLRIMPISFGVFACALPLSTLLFTFHSQFNNPTLANVTFSFFDRLNRMWPEAWTLLQEHGNSIMGRGLGGIGTAQSYYEFTLFNAGDNVFMYFFVVFGVFAMPLFIYILLKTLRVKPQESTNEFMMFCLLMAILVYGSMTNIVENALLAMVCGLAVRWVCSSTDAPPYGQVAVSRQA